MTVDSFQVTSRCRAFAPGAYNITATLTTSTGAKSVATRTVKALQVSADLLQEMTSFSVVWDWCFQAAMSQQCIHGLQQLCISRQRLPWYQAVKECPVLFTLMFLAVLPRAYSQSPAGEGSCNTGHAPVADNSHLAITKPPDISDGKLP
jgi:hypothetical protein